MQSKQYFTKIKNYPHEKSTEPIKGDVSRSFDTSPFPLKAEYINYSQGEVYEL